MKSLHRSTKFWLLFFAYATMLIFLSSCRSSPNPLGSWSAPRFNKDASSILFTAVDQEATHAMAYSIESQSLQVINLPIPKDDSSSEPTLSPDGTTLAFIWWQKGAKSGEVCISDQDGKKFRQLTTSGMRNSHLFFSQDSTKIGFTRTSSTFRSGYALCYYDLTQNKEIVFEQTGAYSIINPSFSFDGNIVMYSTDEDYVGKGNQDLVLFNIKTGESTRPIKEREWLVPVYVPGSEAIVLDTTNMSRALATKPYRDRPERFYGVFYYSSLDAPPKYHGISTMNVYYMSISNDGKKLLFYSTNDFEVFDLETSTATSIVISKEEILKTFAKWRAEE